VFLRAHDLGTAYGPPKDELDVEPSSSSTLSATAPTFQLVTTTICPPGKPCSASSAKRAVHDYTLNARLGTAAA
jgi:hypothetical protein